jgi:hypothetical protein
MDNARNPEGKDTMIKDGRNCQLAPKNLTKSVSDLTDLSSYGSGPFDAIVCCYGYGLSSDVSLSGPGEFEAHLIGAGFDQPGAVVAT